MSEAWRNTYDAWKLRAPGDDEPEDEPTEAEREAAAEERAERQREDRMFEREEQDSWL